MELRRTVDDLYET